MNQAELINDIPLQTAIAAHNGTSFSPERRGESERNEYAQTLAQDYAGLARLVERKPDLQPVLEGLTQCCGQSPVELPIDDKMTNYPNLVTCPKFSTPKAQHAPE